MKVHDSCTGPGARWQEVRSLGSLPAVKDTVIVPCKPTAVSLSYRKSASYTGRNGEEPLEACQIRNNSTKEPQIIILVLRSRLLY